MRHGQKGYYLGRDFPQRSPISADHTEPGWWELAQLWKIYPGQFTLVTGYPGHGKSTFLLNVIINLAKNYGTRSFLFVPENEAHIIEKLRLIWGPEKGFDGFLENYLHIQSCNEDYDTPMDLFWVLKQANIAIDEDHCDILLIDPWNELEHYKPRDITMTDFIRDSLREMKRFLRAKEVSLFLVAHPTKPPPESASKPPSLFQVEGSASWYNKLDNGLIVHREGNTAKVISAKVREMGAGKLGVCHFMVDEATGRFTPQYGAVS